MKLPIKHEIEDTPTRFRHRIVRGKSKGPWASYTSPAVFHLVHGTIVAITDNYRGTPEYPDPVQELYFISPIHGNEF